MLHGVEAIGGLKVMGAELVPTILSFLPAHVRGSHTALRSTIFGSNIVDAGLEDTITMGRQVIYDLFVLVIFLECEENQDENRSEQFDAPNMFKIMLDVLKEYEKKTWLLSHDVEVWVGGASEISSDDGCVWLECDLLAHGNIALASEFSRFQPTTPWSTYIKGRLCLARSEYENAAFYFQKAAYPLGELTVLLGRGGFLGLFH